MRTTNHSNRGSAYLYVTLLLLVLFSLIMGVLHFSLNAMSVAGLSASQASHRAGAYGAVAHVIYAINGELMAHQAEFYLLAQAHGAEDDMIYLLQYYASQHLNTFSPHLPQLRGYTLSFTLTFFADTFTLSLSATHPNRFAPISLEGLGYFTPYYAELTQLFETF